MNSSTSGGAGTMAENVIAGSVPMATATSMRPCGRGPSDNIAPPEDLAIMSTDADFVPARARAPEPPFCSDPFSGLLRDPCLRWSR
jgi:hypothetical protein